MRTLFALLLLTAPAFASDLDARAQALYHQLRCVVCEGQSIADSNAEMAEALRATVREKLENNESDAKILQDLRAVYGDAILMKPPLKPATFILWIMPALALLAGAAMMARSLRRQTP